MVKFRNFLEGVRGAALKIRSTFFQNVITNYLAVIWMGGLSIVLIPFYLRLLGPAQWGVVAVCMTIQGAMGLLDSGLAQIMPKDIALARGDKSKEASVFALFGRAYLAIGAVGLLLGQLAVPYLVAHWFDGLQQQEQALAAEWALRLVLVQFFFQFSNNAHVGYWNGIQAQKKANLRHCVFGTSKHIGALSLVNLWPGNAIFYVAPFACVAVLEFFLNRRNIKIELKSFLVFSIRRGAFLSLAKNAGVLGVGVIIGMLVSQLDRIVLSATLDPIDFGLYVVVANLGLAFMQLQHPLMRALFPRVVLASAGGFTHKNTVLFMTVFFLCVAPCLLVALAAPWVLDMWLSDPKITSVGTAPLQLILCAVAVNSVYHLIYQRILAVGENRVVVFINGAVLLLVAPLLFVLAPIYGSVAGGYAWFVSAFLQLMMGLYWLFRR